MRFNIGKEESKPESALYQYIMTERDTKKKLMCTYDAYTNTYMDQYDRKWKLIYLDVLELV